MLQESETVGYQRAGVGWQTAALRPGEFARLVPPGA
jgi:hypothetical protein